MTRDAPIGGQVAGGPGYRAYVLGMLLLVYLVSLVDRQIMAVMIEPIRRDLRLSDTQLGLLSGLAFGLLYATMAVPLSRLGDRWSRPRLIAACLAVWSVATAACGAAGGFLQLFAARVLVGTGEAGAGPSSHALISDYFPAERRGTALGIYSMGIFMGAGLGLILGGVLLAAFGWRGAFLAAGVPGLAIALLFVLTVRDPRPAGSADGITTPRFAESFGTVIRSKPLLGAAFGLGFSVFTIQALLNWLPALLARQYGYQPQQAAQALGPVVALSGMIGVLAGGIASDRASRGDAARSPLLMAAASALIVPVGIAGLLADSGATVLLSMAPVFFLNACVAGPSFAMFQNYAPPRLRALAAAIAGLIAVLLGNALGPFAGGAFSDLLAYYGASDPLRWSLVACVGVSGLGAVSYLFAAYAVRSRAAAEPHGL